MIRVRGSFLDETTSLRNELKADAVSRIIEKSSRTRVKQYFIVQVMSKSF